MVTQFHHNIHWGKHFSAARCWTNICTTSTFHTSIKIKHLQLIKILYLANSKRNIFYICFLINIPTDGSQFPWIQLTKKHIYWCCNEVRMFRLRHINKERQNSNRMDPPKSKE